MNDANAPASAERMKGWSGARPLGALDRWIAGRLLQALGGPGFRVVLASGEELGSADPLVARVRFRGRSAIYRLALDPDFQFGELYSDGRIEVEGDLVALLEAVFRGQLEAPGLRERLPGWLNLPQNTLSRARDNVHHHYDLGNDFFRLWLDERMVYTCAYFPTERATLEEAQLAKLEHVCRKLRLRPGETVVEAGCGWGSLALHMAQRHGVTVKAFNISRAQVVFAREQAAAEGLADRVEFIEDDYRNISGSFDAFVSVGMLEHVGTRHYRELGQVIDRVLTPLGRGLIHTIGRNRPARPNPWVTARIFPGGYPPSLREMAEIFEPYCFSVLDVENLRLHYALTLRHWLDRFEAQREQVGRLFDDRFVRMWRLYLAGAQAAFTTGAMQLFQVVFARGTNNDLPLTREHLYRSGARP
jgi:cyclopropane-fatty-acyl-phospholipid synthase